MTIKTTTIRFGQKENEITRESSNFYINRRKERNISEGYETFLILQQQSTDLKINSSK